MKSLKVFRPVSKKAKISSPFGVRKWNGKEKMHNGIDFSIKVGTPIRAMCPGFIFKAGYENEEDKKQGYGLRVWQEVLYEFNVYDFFYGHLSKLAVKPGDFVTHDSILGYSGNTGRSTGPHLHVGIRNHKTGKYYNMEFCDV